MNKRFGKNLSLLQIGTSHKQYIIDPLLYDISCLQPILESPDIEKIFFDGYQDIQMLKLEFGFEIKSIFDIASAYHWLWPADMQKGLNDILSEFYQVTISKELQRTDWSKRPLTQAMIHYAATDVAYLIPLRQLLYEKLQEKGWEDYVTRYFDSMELILPVHPEVEEAFMFLKLKNYQLLTPLERLIVKMLFDFRITWGRKNNRPAYFLMHNDDIFQLAQEKPKDQQELLALGMKQLQRKANLCQLILRRMQKIIRNFEKDPHIYEQEVEPLEKIYTTIGRRYLNLIQPNLEPIFSLDLEIFNAQIKRLNKWRKEKSQELDVPKDLLLSNHATQQLSTFDFKGRDTIPLVPGLTQTFRDQFGREIYEEFQFRDYQFFQGLYNFLVEEKSQKRYPEVYTLFSEKVPKRSDNGAYIASIVTGINYRFTINFRTKTIGIILSIRDTEEESIYETLKSKNISSTSQSDKINSSFQWIKSEKSKYNVIIYEEVSEELVSESLWLGIYYKMLEKMQHLVSKTYSNIITSIEM